MNTTLNVIFRVGETVEFCN